MYSCMLERLVLIKVVIGLFETVLIGVLVLSREQFVRMLLPSHYFCKVSEKAT